MAGVVEDKGMLVRDQDIQDSMKEARKWKEGTKEKWLMVAQEHWLCPAGPAEGAQHPAWELVMGDGARQSPAIPALR